MWSVANNALPSPAAEPAPLAADTENQLARTLVAIIFRVRA